MQLSEPLKSISVEEVRKKPELITELFLDKQDVSLVLEKHGDILRYAYIRVYHDESHRILAKAKKEFARKQEEGYSREEAVQEFLEVQESIRKQL